MPDWSEQVGLSGEGELAPKESPLFPHIAISTAIIKLKKTLCSSRFQDHLQGLMTVTPRVVFQVEAALSVTIAHPNSIYSLWAFLTMMTVFHCMS